ncbi:hypothetical protein VJI72_02210 [Parvimonas micra]|uniref:hypothetical protein n=1 Tax=Parvimonas micra TaxID=33033 RepID=UPI002B45D5E4|nr:hypothetical protein [Parvimonas micra]MEB3028608.1 hypothetical protein [Parvimonas micra]
MNKKKNINIQDFVKLVEINRKYCLDNCEYEVSKNAMSYYLKFECYKCWEIINDNRWKGAFLLKKGDDIYLTADILTSIKTPINKVSKGDISFGGEYIVNMILNCKNENNQKFIMKDGKGKGRKKEIKIDEELVPSIKAFAMVYYWIGNMIPVAKNYSPGKSNYYFSNDTWESKLKEILNVFQQKEKWDEWKQSNKLHIFPNREGKQKDMWPVWIANCSDKDGLESFFDDNYLCDLFIIENNEIKIKKNVIIYDTLTEDEKKDKYIKWFLDNTNIIIQRSYRILFDFKEDWDKSPKDKKNVLSIMKYVYNQAGVKEENISLF